MDKIILKGPFPRYKLSKNRYGKYEILKLNVEKSPYNNQMIPSVMVVGSFQTKKNASDKLKKLKALEEVN